MDSIAAYVSIGDSMSIDTYPHMELRQSNPEVSERVGAASLLYKNEDNVWPMFRKDLHSAYPNIKFFNLAEDGATTFDFLDTTYMSLLTNYAGIAKEALIVTLTVGGNDLLKLLADADRPMSELKAEVDNLLQRYESVVDLISTTLPRAICILNSIYDPSDGTGATGGGVPDFSDKLSLLDAVNDHIRKYANKKCAIFADIHKHFLGHGIKEPNAAKRWYWATIEPSARGASEIRRLWLIALIDEGLIL